MVNHWSLTVTSWKCHSYILQVWSVISTTIVQKAYIYIANSILFKSTYVYRATSILREWLSKCLSQKDLCFEDDRKDWIMDGFLASPGMADSLTWHVRCKMSSENRWGSLAILHWAYNVLISFDPWCSLEIHLPVVPIHNLLPLYLTDSLWSTKPALLKLVWLQKPQRRQLLN